MYMLTEFGHIMERRFNISENMSRVEHILILLQQAGYEYEELVDVDKKVK